MTVSETMIEVMERFQKAEPESVLIVWTDADGGVTVKSNCGHTLTVGMAEFAKATAMLHLMSDPEQL